jgi:hypothetical protein
MNDSIEKYRYDLVIIGATADQIIRDFKIDGFVIVFSGDESRAFEELKNQLSPVVHRLLIEDKFSFQSLLYRVDISEKDYKNAVVESTKADFEEKLCEMIIRREFQKVITRIYFSKKSDENLH